MTLCILFLFALTADVETPQDKTISLFNGKDLTGWHIDVPQADDQEDIKETFIVRNGNLVSLGSPNGHLITDAKHQNYRLNIEYRLNTSSVDNSRSYWT